MTFRASGNSVQLGKADQERETTRNTPRKFNEHPGNWCKPLLKWTLMLISLKKKPSRMRSQTRKRILKRSNESKLVRTKFVFEKTLRRRRWCSAKNPAVPFCEIGNVELIELTKSSIQCPPCSHYVFEGAFLSNCGKLLKLDPDAINSSVHLRFPQEVVNAVRICGSSITTRLETRCGVLQKATEDLLQSGTDGKMMRFTGNLSLPITGRTCGFDNWIILYISTSTTMHRNRRDKDMWTCFIYEVLTKISRQDHHGKD